MKRTLVAGVLVAVGFAAGAVVVYLTVERMLAGLRF